MSGTRLLRATGKVTTSLTAGALSDAEDASRGQRA